MYTNYILHISVEFIRNLDVIKDRLKSKQFGRNTHIPSNRNISEQISDRISILKCINLFKVNILSRDYQFQRLKITCSAKYRNYKFNVHPNKKVQKHQTIFGRSNFRTNFI